MMLYRLTGRMYPIALCSCDSSKAGFMVSIILKLFQRLSCAYKQPALICLFSLIFSFLTATPRNHYPLDTLYHRPEDILPSLWERVDNNPELASWLVIGHSSNEKLPIYALRITNPATGKEESKPSILFHGQHHSEEPVGVELVFFMSRFFLSGYGKDPMIRYFIDNYNLWFIPTMNPEGFRITNRGIYRLKRKNNTDTNMNGIFEATRDGVDLNRNYPFNWEEDDSDDPESPYFKGYEAVSQSEIRSMIDFYEENLFQLAFFYHSSASGTYSERIFFPWRWGDVLSPDYEEILYLAGFLAERLPRAYEEGNYLVHRFNTSRRGFARDYIYSEHGTLAMLIEVGGNSPYGEGIINPPNEVLLRLKEVQTSAMIELLEEYDSNLLTGRVMCTGNNPAANREVVIDGRADKYKQNPVTNEEGYFFYYLLPREEPYLFSIDGHEFTVIKNETEKEELVFRIDEETIPQTFLKKPLNEGEAIIMTNPVFQFFPPLESNENRQREVEDIYITLSDGMKILYREKLAEENGQFILPWIPSDLTATGVLNLQYRNINPQFDKESLANKIVFLNENREVLTYVQDYSRMNSWYLQPETQLGIDYSLYPAGENDYMIDKIKIAGDKAFRSGDVEIALYDGAEKVYQTRSFTAEEDYITYNLSEIMLPDNLFLVISNRGYEPLSIYRERVDIRPVNSGRMLVNHSEWQMLDERDLAVELHLRKRR